MKWILFVLMMVVCILMVMCYALIVTAHNADEKAEKIFRKLIENRKRGKSSE